MIRMKAVRSVATLHGWSAFSSSEMLITGKMNDGEHHRWQPIPAYR